jgi:hypothetical protein
LSNTFYDENTDEKKKWWVKQRFNRFIIEIAFLRKDSRDNSKVLKK